MISLKNDKIYALVNNVVLLEEEGSTHNNNNNNNVQYEGSTWCLLYQGTVEEHVLPL